MKKNMVRGMVVVALLTPVAACSSGGGSSKEYCATVKTLASDMKSLTSGSGAAGLSKAKSIGENARKAASQAPNDDAKLVWTKIGEMMDKAAKGDISGISAITNDKDLKAKSDKVGQDVKKDCNIDLNKS